MKQKKLFYCFSSLYFSLFNRTVCLYV